MLCTVQYIAVENFACSPLSAPLNLRRCACYSLRCYKHFLLHLRLSYLDICCHPVKGGPVCKVSFEKHTSSCCYNHFLLHLRLDICSPSSGITQLKGALQCKCLQRIIWETYPPVLQPLPITTPSVFIWMCYPWYHQGSSNVCGLSFEKHFCACKPLSYCTYVCCIWMYSSPRCPPVVWGYI